ncbi:hypothetical protein DFJ74DRAFT_744759 [Hyaloraphidium curvatum]|nr:hypothetical protein DFJ74DRAFT_744759 [Hyaloraphidium curvatum]
MPPIAGSMRQLLLLMVTAAVLAALAAAPAAARAAAEDAAAGEGALERRQAPTCVRNLAVGRTLCNIVRAGAAGAAELGSPNGQFAFVLADGNPRLLQRGVAAARWNSNVRIARPTGCAAFTTVFLAGGDIALRCRGVTYATVVVSNAGARPSRATISNTGVVTFFSSTGRLLLTIRPGSGPAPASAFSVRRAVKTTTRRIVRTTSKAVVATTRRATSTWTATATRAAPATATPRDPLLHPFAHYSIWNLPLGDQAQMVPLNYVHMTWSADNEHLFLDSTAPMTPIWYNKDQWTGADRCSIDARPQMIDLPVHRAFVGKPARRDYRPNASSAFIMADNLTIVEMQPVTRCVDGGPITSDYVLPGRGTILGGGRSGSHAGSGLSALGGSLRTHEFTNTTYPDYPRHALKTFIDGTELYYPRLRYRFPATTGDVDDRKGTNPHLAPGSLIALPAWFDIERRLKSPTGKILANTLRSFGAYVDDDAASDTSGYNIESSWGLLPAMPATGTGRDYNAYTPRQGHREFLNHFLDSFKLYWFSDFTINQNCTIFTRPVQQPTRAWCEDLLDITRNLHVVVNWDAKAYWDLVTDPANYNTVGVGGGKPLSFWAAPLPEDPLLKPCLARGETTCRSRGLTVDATKDSPWMLCLFETQLNCYVD